MKSFFIERLVNRTIGKELLISIKPAVTPDVVPEDYFLAEQQFIQLPSASPIRSEMPSAVFREHITSRESGPASKQKTPMPSAKTISEAALSSDTSPVKTDVYTRYAKARNIESKEESNRIRTLTPRKSRQTPPPEKIQKQVAHTKDKTEDMELEDPTHKSVSRRGSQVSKRDYAQTQPKKETLPEKINRHASSPTKHLQRQPFTVSTQKPFGQDQIELSVAPLNTRPLISAEQSLERSREPEPTVTVSIGRIEVRAVMQQKPATKPRIPVLSLKDYIKQRSGGSR